MYKELNNLFLILFLYFLLYHADAKVNQWAYLKGNGAINVPLQYNELDPSNNTPGGREGGVLVCHKEKLYLFGGQRSINNDPFNVLNDLWEYDIDSNVWIEKIGLDPDDDTLPMPRYDFASCFDGGDLLYIFGGRGMNEKQEQPILDDFWSYNISDNTWESFIFNERPMNRYGASLWCRNGDVYLFGGRDINSNYHNDLHVANFDDGKWIKLKSSMTPDAKGIYEGPDPIPGSRFNVATWVGSDNHLWLYGGHGYGTEDEQGKLSDMWVYIVEDNRWEYKNGPKETNLDDPNHPSARQAHTFLYDSNHNRGWLFGGYGVVGGLFNDLWNWDRVEWKVLKELNEDRNGYYVTDGFSDSNYPGARYLISSCLHDDGQGNINLYFYGGYGYGTSDDPEDEGYLNDLWVYNAASTEPDVIDGVTYINTTQEFYGNITIKNTSTIIVPPSDKPIIINHGDSPINIEGGEIIINIDNEDEYNNILSIIKSNGEYEMIIVSGKYNGTFDNIKIELNDDIKSCEKLISKQKENQDKTLLSVTFTIDSSSCKSGKNNVTMWIIIGVCIGVALLVIVAIIVVLKSKTIRRKVFPYQKRQTEANEKKENAKVMYNETYQTKTKRNPIHETM